MKLRAEQVRLFLLPEVEARIRHYADLAQGEVSGLGTVEEFDGGFLVNRVYLPKQTCTSSGTTLEEDAVATLLLELEEAGEDSGKLKCWFHSHAHHNVFWSPTDEECIAGLANGDFILSLVTNKGGAMLARLDIYHPVRITLDDIPVSVRAVDEELRDTCAAEIAANVSEMLGPMLPKLPARDMYLDHWSRYPMDVVDEMAALRERHQGGETTARQYFGEIEEETHEW